MSQVRVLRIVVASASDVQAERDAIPDIIEYLNKGIAKDRGVRLEFLRWETSAYPRFHPDGPQGGIDEILRIEDCDIFIGILWKRFGTPTKDAQSGTEHEFRLAYKAWRKTGRPQIMFYFSRKPFSVDSSNEVLQLVKVLKFKESFPDEGLWWSYKNKSQFEKLLLDHLTNVIRSQPLTPAEVYAGESAGSSQKSIEPNANSARRADLSMDIGSAPLNEQDQRSLLCALSAFLNIPLSDIEIVSVDEARGGKITIKLPLQSAERLLQAYKIGDSNLARVLPAFAIRTESEGRRAMRLRPVRRPLLSHIPSLIYVAAIVLFAFFAVIFVVNDLAPNGLQRLERSIDNQSPESNITKGASQTVILEPYIALRGDDEEISSKKVYVSASHVILLLHFPEGEPQESYEVSFIDPYSEPLFTVQGLKCSEGKHIPIRLSKRLIPLGEYRLAVSHGKNVPVYYVFTVVRND